MKKKKKINPRRIPMAKSKIDSSAILDEATDGDMYQAWMLVVCSLLEQQLIGPEEVASLADEINRRSHYLKFTGTSKDRELQRIEKVMGMPNPYSALSLSNITSEYELEKLKRKVKEVALHTSLCVFALCLEKTGRYSAEELYRIFFSADLTLAEIRSGCNSYERLEESLAKENLSLAVDESTAYTRVLVRSITGIGSDAALIGINHDLD